MEDLIPILFDILEQYGYIIVFLGTVIGGELVVLAAVFLASLGILNIYLVILISIVGIVTSDSIWYFIGTKVGGKIDYCRKHFCPAKYQHKIESFSNKFVGHYAKFIIGSKFVYGFRIITLVTSGYQHIPYNKFLKFNLIGSCIWLVIIVFLGYVMGFSWNYLAEYSEYAKYYVLFGVLGLFVVRYIFKKFIKFLDYEQRG